MPITNERLIEDNPRQLVTNGAVDVMELLLDRCRRPAHTTGAEILAHLALIISGLFFALAFGFAGIGSAVLGHLADKTSIGYVFELCAYLPLIGFLTVLLPDIEPQRERAEG